MTTVRNADETRARLLRAAFDEIYEHGYQGMRVDDVLGRTGLKKGAFYHHFPSKQALGYAVIDEVLYGFMGERWIRGMAEDGDPIAALESMIDQMMEQYGDDKKFCGCPLNNLAQEMAPLDEGFQERIERTFSAWIGVVADALRRGQENGTVAEHVDADAAATFFVAAFEGCVGLTKASQRRDTFDACRRQLSVYLQTLRATADAADDPPSTAWRRP
jgi:AcrR family transcriptional regulator